jgi:hypothetical protein
MKRKPRLPAHAAKVAIDTMVAAASPLPACPAYIALRAQDVPFWEAILRARARDEWTESDLAVGAQLARCRADFETESRLLDGESSILTSDKGWAQANPRIGIIAELARRETMLMRSLRMAGPTPIRDLNASRGMQRAAERMRAEVSAEGSVESLLA